MCTVITQYKVQTSHSWYKSVYVCDDVLSGSSYVSLSNLIIIINDIIHQQPQQWLVQACEVFGLFISLSNDDSR